MQSDWLKRAVVLLLLLGLFFRFFNLDRKIYWLDETYTSLRLSGYRQTELVQDVTGKIVSANDLQRYQHLSERGLPDTFKGLAAEEPQLTPLYFILTRLWAEQWGDSVWAIRSLSAVISLLAFPALWWLCLELFQSARVGWIAVALFAISPLQVLYAQEARPYSLWTVTILGSSAVLLWALRSKRRLGWSLYAVTVALGLYTHLLFGTVVLAHAVYLLATREKHHQLPYGLATAAGCLTLLPWLMILSQNFAQAESATAGARDITSFWFLLSQWLVNSSRVFVGWDLGFANLIPALGLLYSLYFLCSRTAKQTWLLLLALVAIPFLILALPDLFLDGERSTRIRYLIPCYVAMQIAVAYLFASQTAGSSSVSNGKQKYCRMALVGLIAINLAACGISAQAQVWWNKSVPRSSYYPAVSAIINQADAPLIISDCCPMEVLAFSRWLDADVQLQLIKQPQDAKVPAEFSAVFLLNPSERLQEILVERSYSLKLVFQDQNAPEVSEDRLWQVKR